MEFTEEEFFGNTQNSIGGEGELVPLNKEEQKKQEINMVQTIGLTFFKTIIAIFGSIFYCFAVMVCLMPQKAIKVFDFMSLNKAELFCYERVYKQEKNLANLYNVVQKSIENKDHYKTSKYIKELQSQSEYANFCIKVNSASLKVSAKEHIAYVGDLDGYLVSQNIYAFYEENKKETAKEVALNDLKNQNIYSFGFSSYVECLENDDSLTEAKVNEKILEVINSSFDSNVVLDLIKQRRENVDVSLSNGTTSDKILRVYTSLKIEKVLHKIYGIMGEETLKSQIAQSIQALQNEYNNLVR